MEGADLMGHLMSSISKYCPQDMLNDGYWSTFVQRVNRLRASRK